MIDIYRLWRPSPLFRATRLERALETPAHIYFKYEGVSPAGSHKPNTAVPQAYYNKEAGIRRIATETGRRPMGLGDGDGVQLLRPGLRRLHGEGVVRPEALPPHLHGDVRRVGGGLTLGQDEQRPCDPRGPSRLHRLAGDRDQRGGRGRGDARGHELRARAACSGTSSCTRRSSGSRPRSRWRWRARQPDVVVGCVGGGSNYAGLSYPFMAEKLRGDAEHAVRGHRAGRLPHPHQGPVRLRLRRHRQDRARRPMYTLGHDFVPAPVHAGGLRYHGDAPSLSMLVHEGHMEAKAYTQNQIFEAAIAVRARRRASSPRRSRATRSRARSTRRSPRARPARSA